MKAGRVKSIGLSNFNEKQIQNVLNRAEIKPANLQVEIQLYHQQNNLVNFCKRNDISVTAYSPLGSPGMSAFYETYGVKYGGSVIRSVGNTTDICSVSENIYRSYWRIPQCSDCRENIIKALLKFCCVTPCREA